MQTNHKNYICIAGDLINSSHYYSEPLLTEIVSYLNEQYKKSIVTPFAIRLGDEIVGTLDKFSDGYRLLIELYRFMKKNDRGIYVGIGFGGIDNPSTKNIHMVNGSAIRSAIRARDEYLKKRNSESEVFNRHKGTLSFYALVEDLEFPCKAVNHFMTLIYEQMEHQTPKQIEVIEVLERSENVTYKQIASELGIKNENESNISKLLKRANYELVKEAQQSLFELLDFLQSSLEYKKEGLR